MKPGLHTHSIAYGYNKEMPLFRRGITLLQTSENLFATPVRYTEKPLVSGRSMSFFNELKRRNVFRVGIAYAVSAWVLLQDTLDTTWFNYPLLNPIRNSQAYKRMITKSKLDQFWLPFCIIYLTQIIPLNFAM